MEKIKIINDPYKVWIVDNFFDDDTINLIDKSWPDVSSQLWHRGYETIDDKKNLLEQGMLSISKTSDIPREILKILNFMHDPSGVKIIEKITGEVGLLPDETMRWSGLRVMTPGSRQLIHSDARKHPVNNLRKELTCLVYISDTSDDGFFEIWDDDMSRCMHKIEPKRNRLVIFKNTETAYHGVPSVVNERRSIIWSVMSEGQCSNRTKALFVRRPFDSQEIAELGLKRAMISDK